MWTICLDAPTQSSNINCLCSFLFKKHIHVKYGKRVVLKLFRSNTTIDKIKLFKYHQLTTTEKQEIKYSNYQFINIYFLSCCVPHITV